MFFTTYMYGIMITWRCSMYEMPRWWSTRIETCRQTCKVTYKNKIKSVHLLATKFTSIKSHYYTVFLSHMYDINSLILIFRVFWFCVPIFADFCQVLTANENQIHSLFALCCRCFSASLRSQFAIHWHHSSMMFRRLTQFTYHTKEKLHNFGHLCMNILCWITIITDFSARNKVQQHFEL
jgi:hypothetical protein